MKYINKIMAFGLAILFLTALVIGTGIILSVRNVNVSYSYIGDNEYEEEFTASGESLKKLKGSGILFVSDDDVLDKITDSEHIAVERYEKVFPCTINVYLRQRTETYAVEEGDGEYSLYDEYGALIKSGVTSSVTPTGPDGCPLILVKSLGDEDMTSVGTVCTYFYEAFGGLGRLLESIAINSASFVLNMRSGIKIRFYFANSGGSIDKTMVEKAYAVYSKLTDGEKLHGEIAVLSSKTNAEYMEDAMPD